MHPVIARTLFWMWLIAISVVVSCGKEEDDDKHVPLLPDPDSVTDIEGNEYPVVRIGNQLWMAENLRVSLFNDGTPVPSTSPTNLDMSSLPQGIYQWVTMYDTSYLIDLGRVYSFDVATHPHKEICPEGWRIPTMMDWQTLNVHLGGSPSLLVDAQVLMEEESNYWKPGSDPTAGVPNNETGFTARGGGVRLITGGDWMDFKEVAYFMIDDYKHGYLIDYNQSLAYAGAPGNSPYKHIRCLKKSE